MAIPSVSRARDLLVSLIAACPIEQFGTQWDGETVVEIPLAPETWMERPDPRTTRSHWLAWIADDLIFHGRAFAYVTSRNAQGFPASFAWLPAEAVDVQAAMWAGNFPITEVESIRFNGTQLPTRDVVAFWGNGDPVLRCGAHAVLTAERLNNAALRFATSPTPMGWLQQTGGEPLSSDDLADLAAGWAEARETNVIAALNEYVTFHEASIDPSKLQLVEARAHQDVEIARVMSVPSYLINADTGSSMTYQNADMARRDLAELGAQQLILTIEQTLSGDNVTPRGRRVRLRRYWEHVEDNTQLPAPAAPATNGVPA